MRPTPSSPAACRRSSAGRAAACRDGPVTWPTPRTLSRKRSLQTFKHLETFDARGEGALQAYLRQAVMNRIRDHIRRVGRRPAGPNWIRSTRTLIPRRSSRRSARETVERYEAALAG